MVILKYYFSEYLIYVLSMTLKKYVDKCFYNVLQKNTNNYYGTFEIKDNMSIWLQKKKKKKKNA